MTTLCYAFEALFNQVASTSAESVNPADGMFTAQLCHMN